jgi:hypothetical protein
MKRHIDRISYMHFKDIDPEVKAEAIANRTGFYDACGQGIFCNLGEGDVDFPAVRQILLDAVSRAGARSSRIAIRCSTPTAGRRHRANRAYLNPSASERGPDHDKLKWGMIGGGEGSQIGPAHRLGAGLDGEFEFAAGALDHRPEAGREYGQRLGLAKPTAPMATGARCWRARKPRRPHRSGHRRHPQRHPLRDHQGLSRGRAFTCSAKSR